MAVFGFFCGVLLALYMSVMSIAGFSLMASGFCGKWEKIKDTASLLLIVFLNVVIWYFLIANAPFTVTVK